MRLTVTAGHCCMLYDPAELVQNKMAARKRQTAIEGSEKPD